MLTCDVKYGLCVIQLSIFIFFNLRKQKTTAKADHFFQKLFFSFLAGLTGPTQRKKIENDQTNDA